MKFVIIDKTSGHPKAFLETEYVLIVDYICKIYDYDEEDRRLLDFWMWENLSSPFGYHTENQIEVYLINDD